jgi:hypothetical protein
MNDSTIATLVQNEDGSIRILWNHAPLETIERAINSLNHTSKFRKYVEAGAAWLDELYGTKIWRNDVNLGNFNMEDTDKCIVSYTLGEEFCEKMFGGIEGLDSDYHTDENIVKYAKLGFVIDTTEDEYTEDEREKLYRVLTETWDSYIRETRNI